MTHLGLALCDDRDTGSLHSNWSSLLIFLELIKQKTSASLDFIGRKKKQQTTNDFIEVQSSYSCEYWNRVQAVEPSMRRDRNAFFCVSRIYFRQLICWPAKWCKNREIDAVSKCVAWFIDESRFVLMDVAPNSENSIDVIDDWHKLLVARHWLLRTLAFIHGDLQEVRKFAQT